MVVQGEEKAAEITYPLTMPLRDASTLSGGWVRRHFHFQQNGIMHFLPSDT